MRTILLAVGLVLVLASSSSAQFPDIFGKSPEEEEKARQEEVKKAQQALAAKAKTQELFDLLDTTSHHIADAMAELERYATVVEPLLSNEEGRTLASDELLTGRFQTVYEEKRTERRELEDAKRRVADLTRGMKERLGSAEPLMPPKELETQVRSEATKADEILESYRDARETVEALVREARRKQLQPSTNTLQAAMQDIADRKRLAALDEKRREQQERDEALAKKEKEALDAEAQAERRRREQESSARMLEADAANQAIRDQFLPFTAAGRYTGGKISNSNFLQEHGLLFPYAKPMSFSALTSADFHNVLTDFNLFVNIACGANGYASNDRPKWPYPRSDEQVRLYRERWQQFRRLAPVWKRTGVLSN